MLTPERIKELSHPIVARVELHHDQATSVTGNLWIEGIERFAVLIEAEVRAAARAEVEPLVRQILEALENTSDLVFKDVRLSHTRNLALQLGRAWLAEKPQEAPHATPS